MHRMIIFDHGMGQLGPMADLRASFEIRTGMHTTAARIAACWPRTLAGYWVPERVRELVAARANAPVNDLPGDEMLFCVNGRWALPDASLRLDSGEALVEGATGHVVAAALRRADAEYFLTTGQLHERARTQSIPQRVLYKYPWDVVALMKRTIPHDLESMRMVEASVLAGGGGRRGLEVIGDHPVEVHAKAFVGPHVVFDATEGAIIVHENAVIRPGAIICGPCSICSGATIVDRAHIKPYTVIGPMCKVGGEVGGTIFQGYSNKAHEGHLGDSWVGKWVNLGAGTTNSNLLNTYGEVTMRIEADGPRLRTGLTFLGAIIGDHVKTAISTRLMTGASIGTGAMIATASTPPRTIRRFAWITDDGERIYRYEKFLESMTAMMARRERTPGISYLTVLAKLHEKHIGATTKI